MAVYAVGKRQWFLEVAVDVALRAAHCRMFSEQRVLCLRMVKFEPRHELFPARRRMAVLTALGLERPLVRIHVAIEALSKLHVLIARRASWNIWLVAFFAGYLNMPAGQRIARLGMIKLLRRFPVRKAVALQAVVPEVALVRVLMAGHAIL